MPKDCPLNKFLDCEEEKCAFWIYRPKIKVFDGAKGYDVVKRPEIRGCAIKIFVEEKLNEKNI